MFPGQKMGQMQNSFFSHSFINIYMLGRSNCIDTNSSTTNAKREEIIKRKLTFDVDLFVVAIELVSR